MSCLLIDSYNVYMKVKHFKGDPVTNFFKYVNSLKYKFTEKYTYFLFDGDRYIKKTIDSSFKENRNENHRNKDMFNIQNVVINMPKFFMAYHPQLEADDISYCLCQDIEKCTCVSDDIDWIRNIAVNPNTRIFRNGETLHQFNFESKMGYPLNKISLALFLKGDIKDNVKKPFSIRGELNENVNKYFDVDDYRNSHQLYTPEVDTYIKLISPITGVPFRILRGQKTDKTRELVNHFKLTFFKKSKKVLNECLRD